ncbi:MAG TPA: hypothetical protein VK207_08925 [Bacteroidales bacterium]|nr:hypothetical protein [Bacteroidales bacterium]
MELTKEKAKVIYPHVPESFKKELEEAFGKKFFEKKDWKDIKTFEDACKALDVDPDAVCSDSDTRDEAAYKKLKVIIQAINQGWSPDWNNTNQRKWWPWFTLSSGFGFSVSAYRYGYSGASVGSRLCFESESKSDYCARQFLNLYEEFLTIKN